MHGPTRIARIAYALAFGFSGAASPALAQVASSQPIEAWPYVTQPDARRPADAPAADAPPAPTPQAAEPQAAEPPADPAPPLPAPAAESRRIEAWPYVTRPHAARADDAQPADPPSPDMPAADMPPAGEPQADQMPLPDDPAAEPPRDTLSADAAAVADALAEEPPAVEAPSGIAALLAHWVTTSGDSGGLPFIIVDKVAADIFVFDADGLLRGGAPVLVGLAPGDDSAEGVGDRDLSAITPDERTTPAGRFVAQFGYASGDKKVLWVDYPDAISLHPVVTTNRKERRLQRIRSADPEDHRISYGCINVPASFYSDVVLTTLGDGAAVVYVLPESKPVAEVFPAFAIAAGISAAPPAAAADAPASPDPSVEAATSPASAHEATATDHADARRPPATESLLDAAGDYPTAPDPASPARAPDNTLFGSQ